MNDFHSWLAHQQQLTNHTGPGSLFEQTGSYTAGWSNVLQAELRGSGGSWFADAGGSGGTSNNNNNNNNNNG